MTEDRVSRTEDQGWRTEDDGGRWTTEEGGRRMEDGGWMMEDGGRRKEDGRFRREDGGCWVDDDGLRMVSQARGLSQVSTLLRQGHGEGRLEEVFVFLGIKLTFYKIELMSSI